MMLGGGSPEEGGGPGLLGTGVEVSGVTVNTERGPRILGAGSARLRPEQLWPSAASTQCPDPPRREQPGSWEKGRLLPATQGTGWAGNVSAGSKNVPKGWGRVWHRGQLHTPPPSLEREEDPSPHWRQEGSLRRGHGAHPGRGTDGDHGQRMASYVLSP